MTVSNLTGALALSLLLPVAMLACVSTQLEVGKTHPANASAETTPLPNVGAALKGDIEPPQKDETKSEGSGPSSDHAHAGHQHGGGSATAPEPPSDTAPTETPKGDATERATQWTCPMHPEVVKTEPGNCPICGMKLTPLKPKDSGEKH